MEQVQVSIPCKTPLELQEMAKKLFRCGLKSTIIQKGSSYTLWRDIKANECDIPVEGYWIFERNQFYRNERAAKLYRKARRKEMRCLSQKLKRIG